MTPQEIIAEALAARFMAKNGGLDEIIRISHRDSAEVAVQALLDAGWDLLSGRPSLFPTWTGGTDSEFHYQRGWNDAVRATADNEHGPATRQTAGKDPSNKAEEGKQ